MFDFLTRLEATHNEIRGNNNFEKLVAPIRIATRFGKETSTITTVLKDNIDALGEIRELSESLGVKNQRFQLFFEGAKLGLDDISKASDFITERDRSLVFDDAPATLSSAAAIAAMRKVESCAGCACFCAR